MIETISHHDQLYALIVYHPFHEPGVHFFTPGHLSQQLAFMRLAAGTLITPHTHTPVPREVHYTQEVLVIRKGKLRVDFYNRQQHYLESRILQAGDVILLIDGGHGFEVLEEMEMIEVKQGPYLGADDKTVFTGITAERARLPAPPG